MSLRIPPPCITSVWTYFLDVPSRGGRMIGSQFYGTAPTLIAPGSPDLCKSHHFAKQSPKVLIIIIIPLFFRAGSSFRNIVKKNARSNDFHPAIKAKSRLLPLRTHCRKFLPFPNTSIVFKFFLLSLPRVDLRNKR